MVICTGLLIVMSSCDFVIFGEQFNTFKDRKNEYWSFHIQYTLNVKNLQYIIQLNLEKNLFSHIKYNNTRGSELLHLF